MAASLPDKHALFLESALSLEGRFLDLEESLAWLEARRLEIPVEIREIPFRELRDWAFDDRTGNLHHRSGKFFSIEGIRVETNWGTIHRWEQPIINQPEVGYLGIIARRFDGVLHFLLQAKVEPGNITHVQLSPTLQATRSNYTQVHAGKKPRYLSYFIEPGRRRVLLDQLQSEQGARFLKKRNRNIIIEVFDEVPVEEDFCWLTLGQIKQLLRHDNVVNMDTRTVVSGIPFGSLPSRQVDSHPALAEGNAIESEYGRGLFLSTLDEERRLHDTDEVISWITGLKSAYDLDVRRIPLGEVRHWVRDETSIHHEKGLYFSVIAVAAQIGHREVAAWTQPILKASQEGIIAYLIKRIGGVYHFLVQAKLEPGNLDVLELAPTVQCITGNYRDAPRDLRPPFLDYVLDADPSRIRYRALQSEEGGRFYREQNINLIVEVEDEFPLELPANFMWMTANQIGSFIRYNNYLNIEARSLIAAISFL